MKYILAFTVAAGLLASAGGAFAGPRSDLRIDGVANSSPVIQADYYYHHHHYHHRRYHHHRWHYY